MVCFDLLVAACFSPRKEQKTILLDSFFASKPQSTSRTHIFPSCSNSLTISRHFLIVVPFLNTQKSRYLSGQRYVQYHCHYQLLESVFAITVQMPWEFIHSRTNVSRELASLPQKFMYEPNTWHTLMSLYKVHLHFSSSCMFEMSMARRSFRRNTVVSFDIPFTVWEAAARLSEQGSLQRRFPVSGGVGGVLVTFRALSEKARSVPFALIYTFGAVCEVVLVGSHDFPVARCQTRLKWGGG